MADLSELLGALLVSLVHARRLADEETAAIAEAYKEHPLLEGMSLPRVRVPEMILDLPLLIESHESGTSNAPESREKLQNTLVSALNESTQQQISAPPPPKFTKHFSVSLSRELERLYALSEKTPRAFNAEAVVRIVDRVFVQALKDSNREFELRPSQQKIIASELRTTASASALVESGQAPHIQASILTSEVKEKAGNNNVSRLRVILKEEGMEWSVSEDQTGGITRTLTPE